MTLAMLLFIAVLFFVLTPGVLVRLPPNGSKLAVAAVHALVFALVYQLTHKAVWRALYEGFQNNMNMQNITMKRAPKKPAAAPAPAPKKPDTAPKKADSAPKKPEAK